MPVGRRHTAPIRRSARSTRAQSGVPERARASQSGYNTKCRIGAHTLHIPVPRRPLVTGDMRTRRVFAPPAFDGRRGGRCAIGQNSRANFADDRPCDPRTFVATVGRPARKGRSVRAREATSRSCGAPFSGDCLPQSSSDPEDGSEPLVNVINQDPGKAADLFAEYRSVNQFETKGNRY